MPAMFLAAPFFHGPTRVRLKGKREKKNTGAKAVHYPFSCPSRPKEAKTSSSISPRTKGTRPSCLPTLDFIGWICLDKVNQNNAKANVTRTGGQQMPHSLLVEVCSTNASEEGVKSCSSV